ncbi:hypothetical protein KUCAC02_005618 [Chaenocephalus aceratus]|uniref:Uncharacterized protein n=1 Tax=Chaenocephalus aceratus TaxID=36190 RepID=A0ACB9WQL5_CHAAC|nr:hypothetical protein KUCAC02_005618 [Chaenocephalus aceratus]
MNSLSEEQLKSLMSPSETLCGDAKEALHYVHLGILIPLKGRRIERAGEGVGFRQGLSPQPSSGGTPNHLLANPVKTKQKTVVERDLRMTCVSLLAYVLSLYCLKPQA